MFCSKKFWLGILINLVIAGIFLSPGYAANHSNETVVDQHTTMVMDDGMEMSHEHASDTSMAEGNTMSGEDVHKNHDSENTGEEPSHHKHDDRTTGKAGVGPNWPFIYTFLLFNTIVVITAGIMKFKNKEVLGNGRKI